MKIMMTSFLFALSLSASAASFNCQITELDEMGSPISQASDIVVNVSEVSSKAAVIGQSNGRVYGLSIVDGLNICFKYSEAKCVTLAATKNEPGAFLFVKDLVNNASVSCQRL